ncbi:Scr1 family TA system antitoxin-like transcriptional regulator [Streptomyces sp. NPDC102441]|uniref:Scr1 family TA system antitoxin-like transcriptional regulator n=1 Tax=Streptomyces sp. NPDC102441 TaxID=3366176 RepID=UPI00381FF5A0
MTGGRKTGWWEEYRGKIPPGFLDVSALENYAIRLRTIQTAHLPGLFHTEDHARAIFELFVPALPRLEVELRVAHRMARQSVIMRGQGTPYSGVIHEAAIRMQLGGAVKDEGVMLRESDSPGTVLTTKQSALRALVLAIKSREI